MTTNADRTAAVSRILDAGGGAAPRAANELLPLVYEELHELARARMAKEAPGRTIQATALVHEAYLRLVGDRDPGWNGRAHFFGAAAMAMRRILVDDARRRERLRHGGGRERHALSSALVGGDDRASDTDLIAVEEAVRQLEQRDPRKGQIVNLRYFAGLTSAETADALGVSVGTIEREWRFIRAWLRDALAES